MQTPKQTPKQRTSSSDAPQKVSPRVARPLKLNSAERSSGSPSSLTSKITKDRSPKVVDRKSPRSPLTTELISQKKRSGKVVSELESQVSQLQRDLKEVKDNLLASESAEKDAHADAQAVKNQLLEVSSKLEESQKQLSELLAYKESHLIELQNISEEKDQTWQCQLEAVQKQHQVDLDALASALDEIQRLKLQLDSVAVESQDSEAKESTNDAELQCLKENLAETFSLVESMRNELKDCKTSEAQAQELVRETLMQLEAAKETVNVLRMDGEKATEAYTCTASELEESRAHVNFLEGLVKKLQTELIRAKSEISECDEQVSEDNGVLGNQGIMLGADKLEAELAALKSEVGRLKSALQAAEDSHHEAKAENNLQMRRAIEEVDLMKSASNAREAELRAELKKAEADSEELKANLMDKENELQAISEENDSLNMKLERTLSNQRERELENELKMLKNSIGELRANLMDKETELQNISEENDTLKLEMIKRQETDTGGSTKHSQAAAAEIEAARAAERDALTKLGYMMEETDKSNKKAARVMEQLDAAQATYAEMETELRKLKVQSDQWRKAAEAAASMLSPASNGKFVERTGSLDSGYSPVKGRMDSPYDEYEDDAFKKKNGNMLKKIGVLWKKPNK